MSALTFQFDTAHTTSDAVSSDFFGMNTLFTRDNLIEGGAYDTFLDEMATTSLRFPGGTVTEELFSPDNEVSEKFWSQTSSVDAERGVDSFTNVPRFIEYASSINATVDWVLPTESLLTDERDADGDRIVSDYAMYNLLDRVDALIRGEYGYVDIDTFSIGNEYWYNDRMSSSEYGKIANTMSKGLQQVFDTYRDELPSPDAWSEPNIGVQTSLAHDPEGAQEILAELDLDARAAIDTVETHYYPKDYEASESSTAHFDRLDDFQNAEGFGDLNYYISEWNLRLGDNADVGMEAASSLIEMSQTMLENGVDSTSLWGTAYQSLQCRLSAMTPDASEEGGWAMSLTPSGEVVRMMSHTLIGTHALDLELPGQYTNNTRADGAENQVLLHAFGSEERMVFFISSRSDAEIDITLDLSGLVDGYAQAWAQQLSVVDDVTTAVDEGDATSKHAAAHLSTLTEDEFNVGGNYTFNLDAYDIVRVEFTSEGSGTYKWGADHYISADSDYDDTLVGTSWNDTLEGNLGNDILDGKAGHDTIDGGYGDDYIRGGDGDDLLISGAGNDTLLGGRGVDVFITESGENLVETGGGRAHIIASTEGDTTIAGFEAENGDTLSFMRAYSSSEDIMEFASVQDDDLVFTHESGGKTVLTGAASQLEAITSSFSDFSNDAYVAPLLDQMFGSDASAPPAASYAEISADPAIARLLLDGEPEDISTYMNSLDAEQTKDLLDTLNIDTLVSVIDADNFAALLNSLDPEALDEFMAETDPDTLLFQAAMIGDDIDDMLDLMGDDAFNSYLDRLAQSDFTDAPKSLDYDSLSHIGEAFLTNGNGLSDEFKQLLVEREEDDEDEEGTDAPATITGAECFVATAAYQDGDHPDVEYLRNVRDHVLVHSALGRAFVWSYWRVGPHLARALAPFPRGRAAARKILGAMIAALRNADAVTRWGGEYRSTVYLSGKIRIAHAMARKR